MRNTRGWWLLLLNSIFFVEPALSTKCYSRSWLYSDYLQIFSEQTLWVACENIFLEVLDMLIYCWYNKRYCQQFSLKIILCKTSQVSQESICEGLTFFKSCKPSYLELYLKGRHHKCFPVNILISVYLLIVSFQPKLLFLNRPDFRTHQYLLKSPSYFNS